MPTGYTHDIINGQTFEKFVMNCSRAFGALISLRDSPNDTPIPTEIVPSDYHLKEFESANLELIKYQAMTINEADKLCLEAFQNDLKKCEVNNINDLELKAKYEAMLDKVHLWTPPTKEHKGLKDFMIKQIQDSINWDCDRDYKPSTKQSGAKWLAEQIRESERSIKYHESEYKKEVERCKERTEWIQSLVNSLNP